VFRYTEGELGWLADGGPSEGKAAATVRVADAARKDVPRCHLHDRPGDVLRESRAAGWDLSVVVDEDDIVLGLLTERAEGSDTGTSLEEAMQKAPSTIRPHMRLDDAVDVLTRRRRDHVLVTTAAGRLVGLLTLADAKRRTTR
jgi:arabinose-5-phosphate isomerase